MSVTKAALHGLIALIALVAITGAGLALWRGPFTDESGIGTWITLLARVLTAPLAATMHRVQYRTGAILLAGILR